MNILIVGLGSIGQRHLRVLKKNLRKKVNFFTLKSSKNKIVIQDDFKFKRVSSVAKHYNVKKISISEIENYKINTAIISNPPNLHLQTALNLLKRKCNLLIEKPLSTSSSSLFTTVFGTVILLFVIASSTGSKIPSASSII